MSQKTTLLEGLLEIDANLGSIGLKSLVEARKVALDRWETIGLLEGLEGAMRENMATLYESQAYYLIKEADTSSVGGSFETISFPLVRRTYQKLLANELVSVQALNMPIGRLFFFNPQISTTQAQLANYLNGGAVGVAESYSLYDAFYAESANDYGNSLFDRSNGAASVLTGTLTARSTYTAGDYIFKGTVTHASLYQTGKMNGAQGVIGDSESFLPSLKVVNRVSLDATATGATVVASKNGGTPMRFGLPAQRYGQALVYNSGNNGCFDIDVDLLIVNASGDYVPATKYDVGADTVGGTGDLTTAILTDASTTIAIASGETTPYAVVTSATSTVTGSGASMTATDGTIYSTAGTATIPAGTAFPAGTVVYASGGLFVKTGLLVTFRSYSSLEGSDTMAEISFKFDSVTVDASEPRKLRANWSPEVQQDVQAFQSVDVEAEMTALLSETISAEIDRTIMRQIKNEASWLDRWNYGKYNSMLSAGTALGITQKDYNQTLITKINQMSAMIQKSTLRGGASWIVVSPEVGAVLRDLEYFHVSTAAPEERKFSLGIEKIGAIHNDYQVFVDMYATADTILIGHKGDGIFHAGFIFAPYTPVMLFPKVTSVVDFKSVMGVMTRFATKMVNNRFYGKIFVDNLQQIVTGSMLRTGV